MVPKKRCYTDNKTNRKLGRVGLPLGSAPVSKNQDIGNYENSSNTDMMDPPTPLPQRIPKPKPSSRAHGRKPTEPNPLLLRNESPPLQNNPTIESVPVQYPIFDENDAWGTTVSALPQKHHVTNSLITDSIDWLFTVPDAAIKIEKTMEEEKADRPPEIHRRSPSLEKDRFEKYSRREEEGGKSTRMEEIEKLLLEILENQKKQAAEVKPARKEWKRLIKQEVMEQLRVMKEEQEHERIKLRDKWEEVKKERKKWEEWRKDWEEQKKDLEDKIDDLENGSRRQAIVVEGLEDQLRETWMMTKRENDLVEEKYKRNVVKLLMERKVSSYEKAEIAAKLLKLKFDESEAVEAASECSTVELAMSYLQQECKLCFDPYPMSKMVAMLSCEHQCCRICAEEYFKTQIRNCNVLDILCPFCDPLSGIDDDEVFNEYFARMDILLRDVVSAEVHELFQQKLRDWTFEKLGNVKWCAQCTNMYGINDQNQERLVCPHCNFVICALCECKWEKQHNRISCEQFAAWKKANDPEFQAQGLEKHLAEHGISCPMCNFKFSLAKGGCMHFKCLQCKFEFCSGCGQPFRMGMKCTVNSYCEKLGLHAHHPRNCLFYLRDKAPDALQKLLDDSCVPYDTEAAQNDKCFVNVQVETPDGLVDEHCGNEVEENHAGLCRLHYVEYLVDMINRNSIDPIEILDEAELAQELRRHDKEVPDKAPKEMDVAYCVRLRQLITEQIPLEDVCAPTQV